MQKILIVTYYWPPGSGAGVQRWLKFSKYLPQYGWEPVILTVDPEFAAYPAMDQSLANEVPKDLIVHKTRARDYFRIYSKDKSKIPSAGFAINEGNTLSNRLIKFVRGNFFIPDPRRGWNKFAVQKISEIISKEKISHLITTSPPHSTQLIGLKLKKKFPGIRWIADLRDPWTDIYYYNQFYPTWISRKIDSSLEKKVLTAADKIITVGKSLMDLFSLKVPALKGKFEVISNGYDAEDFSGLKTSEPDKFTISYIGTLPDSYPANGFLKALKVLKEKKLDFRLRFVGFVSGSQKKLIIKAAGESQPEFIPYVAHAQAIEYMLNTTALLIIIPDHKSNKSIVTGKLFEYLASGKPVICLGPPDGDAADIIEKSGHGRTFTYEDSEGISRYLTILAENPAISERSSPSVYRRDRLVQKIVAVLNQS
jgi:glycosyltransferase involved in cell wall biosynthesis